jgi:NADH:ubiquinone oxidoreductase subunit E
MNRSDLRPILREKFPPERTYLLPVLHYLQEEFGHLPDWAMQTVAWHLRVPPSEVYGAATSYSELRIDAPGSHVVRVCNGLSCWHSGGRDLLESLSNQLGIKSGETDADNRVTLEETTCGFLCPMAPAVEVDGRWRGRVSSSDIPNLLRDLT